MPFDEALAARIREQLGRRKNVQERKMFGGLGFLLNGNMLVGVWKNALIVRLGIEAAEDAMKEVHVRDFDITGKAMRGWAMVDAPGLAGDDQLGIWIDRAWKFVCHMPAK